MSNKSESLSTKQQLESMRNANGRFDDSNEISHLPKQSIALDSLSATVTTSEENQENEHNNILEGNYQIVHGSREARSNTSSLKEDALNFIASMSFYRRECKHKWCLILRVCPLANKAVQPQTGNFILATTTLLVLLLSLFAV